MSSTSHCEVPGGTDPEPEPKPDPTQETGDLEITNLNLQEENVTIKNMDSEDISMDGWTLVSVDGNQTYEFPSDYVLRKGENVTLTSGRGAYEDPPGVLEWSGAYLWDNNGDTARLYDPQGELIDEVKR
ncbi:lamin tail domain-containing protein [Guptibacillus algicola]|uniref:lamin tail domain-containing protein n=1 Tax=Guptibacillus algicola TaxID=225844 RepID=UPI0021E58950|nr:lamin tail domain-containing protein [Alkalihalobacillus algicola]